MKNSLFLIWLLWLVVLPACDLLERSSPNELDAGKALDSAESAENALMGVYSSMQIKEYYGGWYPLMPDAVTDDIATGGFLDPSLDELGKNQLTSQNLYAEGIWLAIYRTIANCNVLLDALPDIPDFEPQQRASIEAQARALRAWAHFDLLRLYGQHWDTRSFFGIPIVKDRQGIDDIVLRSSVQASYDFILSEIKAAEQLLDEERRPGFVDKITVQAMLAKIYLYARQYPLAAQYATLVINSAGNYGLGLLNPEQIGEIYRTRRNSESIFELVFDLQNRSFYNSLTYSRKDALNTEVFIMAEKALGDFFAQRPSDVRASLLDFSAQNNDSSILPNGRVQKYRGEETRDNPAYLLRLAEIYLIRAEARGLSGGGLEDVNTVRNARGLLPIEPGNIGSEQDFLNLILDERRAELFFEGNRLFDLARTGKFAATLSANAFRAIFPIPLREIKATRGELIQNPGY